MAVSATSGAEESVGQEIGMQDNGTWPQSRRSQSSACVRYNSLGLASRCVSIASRGVLMKWTSSAARLSDKPKQQRPCFALAVTSPVGRQDITETMSAHTLRLSSM